MSANSFPRHCSGAEGQCRRDHDQAHALVQDHRWQTFEAEQAYEHRQAELDTAKADESAKPSDHSPGTKGLKIATHRTSIRPGLGQRHRKQTDQSRSAYRKDHHTGR